MGEAAGVLAAMLSSALGGTAIGATRFVVGAIDPLTLGAFRYGIGFLVLLPIALLRRDAWPHVRDWPGVVALGLLFFAVFPALFNASLIFTTAARGALALSTLPLLTMLAGALLGVERLAARKSAGVLLAIAGVAMALLAGLATAPADAWRGDLLMIAAAVCMAFYNVWSRPFIARSAPITYATLGMGAGGAMLSAIGWARGGFEAVGRFGAPQWGAVFYLGVIGAAATFFLWSYALGRTTPTRVAVSVTVNPITAAIFGAVLLNEPIRASVVLGLVAVLAGIAIATTARDPVRLVVSPPTAASQLIK